MDHFHALKIVCPSQLTVANLMELHNSQSWKGSQKVTGSSLSWEEEA